MAAVKPAEVSTIQPSVEERQSWCLGRGGAQDRAPKGASYSCPPLPLFSV